MVELNELHKNILDTLVGVGTTRILARIFRKVMNREHPQNKTFFEYKLANECGFQSYVVDLGTELGSISEE
jgi:hypothetical protein